MHALAIIPKNHYTALSNDTHWEKATERARQISLKRLQIVQFTNSFIRCGFSQNEAVEVALERLRAGHVNHETQSAYKELTQQTLKTITRSTLCAWIKSEREQGRCGLLPKHKGRVIVEEEWMGIAIDLFNKPSAPDAAAVHRHLVEVMGFSCTYNQVRSHINKQPVQLGRFSPKRIGPKIHKLKEKPYISREWSDYRAGEVYMADGYKADIYLAHPITGMPWRPELTIAVDVASQCIVGWRADNAENQYRVQQFWADTFEAHNHVPLIVYLDNGAGYKNKQSLGIDERGKIAKSNEQKITTGYLQKHGVQKVQFGRPQNPHAKTFIERTNRTIKEDFLKMWCPDFYCGTDRNSDHSKWLHNNRKNIQYPRLDEFTEAFNVWIIRFNNRPHPSRQGMTRGQVWADRLAIAPRRSADEMAKPQKTPTVQRGRVRVNNREYSHAELYAWNHKKVIAEFMLDDESSVTIRTLSGQWICDAPLVAKKDQFGRSYMEDLARNALKQSISRDEKRIAEKKARAGLVIDADQVAAGALETIAQKQVTQESIVLDFDNF